MRRTLRSGIVLGALLGTTSATAHAEPYTSFDVGYAYRSGDLRWASPPAGFGNDPTPVVLDAQVHGSGLMVDGAVGWTVHRAMSIAVEAGLGYASTSSKGLVWSGIGEVVDLRLGGRVEVRCRYPLYARFSYGAEWIGFGYATEDVGARNNVFEGEGMVGLYGALTLGVRMRRLGLFARGEGTRATSEHATFTPLGIVVGADATWF